MDRSAQEESNGRGERARELQHAGKKRSVGEKNCLGRLEQPKPRISYHAKKMQIVFP